MITIDSGPDVVALIALVGCSVTLGAVVGAYITVLFRESLYRLELRQRQEDQDRARWARLMGVDEGVSAHGPN